MNYEVKLKNKVGNEILMKFNPLHVVITTFFNTYYSIFVLAKGKTKGELCYVMKVLYSGAYMPSPD